MRLGPEILLSIALTVAAIVLHELAHGYAAWALGDDTARRAGRLSPNPLRHVDRVGTLLLPGFLLITQLLTAGRVLFMFGWAKPVPVDARRFRDPRRYMALVAIAGPLMNFALAVVAALVLRTPHLPQWAADAAVLFITLNLALGLFNLLPVPPLDGGRIAVGLLPAPLARVWARVEPFGILVVMALMIGPSLLRQGGIEFDPIRSVLYPAVDWAFGLTLRIAGVGGGDA